MTNANTSAFPNALVADGSGYSHPAAFVPDLGGLTKRELFAAMAMQGFCANSHPQISSTGPEIISGWSIEYADSLLAALNQKADL